MTIEGVREQLDEWAKTATGVTLYEGVHLQDFTKDELVILLSKLTDDLMKRED